MKFWGTILPHEKLPFCPSAKPLRRIRVLKDWNARDFEIDQKCSARTMSRRIR